MENFKSRLTSVKAFFLDVDGVLTDGSVTLLPDGEQVRMMNIKDGYAMQLAVKKGYIVAIISGGKSELVRKRLNGLGVTEVHLGIHTKIDTFEELVERYQLKPQEVLYMGDDIPDYEVMRHAGVPTCPKDASPEIKNISIYISDKRGGKGAVRDIIEQVMKVQNKWMDDDGFVW
ncbi:MAG TPA: HAD-IIIA family hydrolase [Bacteroidia bacterium]|jgi:3-deoxy-D-manno-octulosonate 8-phosphate phosphatase (KDO 8-P phosphatase)|nr:HAD-IIIA family hydrolase [Bacteroidia bacterium]